MDRVEIFYSLLFLEKKMKLNEIKKIKIIVTPGQVKLVKELHSFAREIQNSLEDLDNGWEDKGLGGIGIFSGGNEIFLGFRDNGNDGTYSDAATKRESKKTLVDTFNSTLKKFPSLKDVFDIKKMNIEPDFSEIYYEIPVISNKKEEIEKALDATNGWADMKDWRS